MSNYGRCGGSSATRSRHRRSCSRPSAAHFTTAGWRKMVARLGVAAKLGFKAHPHMFRHACGFQLANQSTDTLISGCAQVNNQFYSKKNFTSLSFHADVSECKRQNPSFVAIQSYVADSEDRTSYNDDAMVRDCMKAKGYDIQVQSK
jgi:hypothetical protein